MSLRDGILWSLAAVLLLAAVSPPLQACDGGTAVPDPGNNPGLVEDCKILIGLRDELAGSGSLNWDTQLAMTSWQYIRISGSPSRVTEVSGYQFTGVIPKELGQLSDLRQLYLDDNQLTGTIPVELGRLSRLEWLYLDDNQLTGPIPTGLGQFSDLQYLVLSNNQLTGPIPTELGRLSQLREFSFRGNRLTGPVPIPLNHLPDVYVRNLAANWVGPGQMKVSWDDPGDPTASYEYRLWDPVQDWTDWGEIADLEMTLRAGEGVTIEWTLTGLPTDVAYTGIGIRARNRKGLSPEACAPVRPLEVTTLYFPDYVDGGGWSVQLALSHIAAAEDAEIIVTAYDREGQPIPGFFDPEGAFGIPPLGTRVLRSAGVGEIRRGWIEVKTYTASVSGLLTYRNTETGLEVSVEPVELGNHFALFVEESSGIGTGLAIFKPDPSPTIKFRIYGEDGINPLGEGPARACKSGKLQPGRPNHPRVVRCGWNQYGVPPGLSGNLAVAIRGWLFVRSDWDTIWEAGRIALIGSCDPGHSGSGVAPQS